MPEDLTHAQRVAARAALVALESDLRTVLGDERSNTVELDQTAVGRVSRVDALQQQQMALAEQRRAGLRLAAVRRALDRLNDDPEEFGICAACGEPIGIGRLRALPEATLCVPCQSRRE